MRYSLEQRISIRPKIIIANRLKKITGFILFCVFILLLIPMFLYGASASFKVLVVMSYDDEYAWAHEIKEGIDSVLAKRCTVEYFWLDTKRDLKNGAKKAKQAFKFYQTFQPDGVIAADDNAQSLFVVPYLMNQVKTPVMFCGVNGELKAFGYPASNVSGIQERLHIRNSIAFAQRLLPSIKNVLYINKESPSGRAVMRQYEREHKTYPVESVAFIMPETLGEALSEVTKYKAQSDALFFETMQGIRDDDGRIWTDKEIIPILAKIFGKPLISNNLYHVEYGTLCAVIKTGQEQGKTAAEMLLKAMLGTPVSQIPVTRNQHGKRVINLSVMRTLGIKPGSEALQGVTFVGIEKD